MQMTKEQEEHLAKLDEAITLMEKIVEKGKIEESDLDKMTELENWAKNKEKQNGN